MENNDHGIITAVLGKNTAALHIALKQPDIDMNTRDEDGRTALMHAATEGLAEMVNVLIAGGASVNLVDRENGQAALHFASQGWHIEVVKKLINSNAQVDVVDKFGNSPLWRAVFESKGRGEVIKMLLDAGADKNLANLKGTSPLILSKRISNFDVAKFMT